MEEQLEVMGARRWAGHSLAAPDSLGQKVEQAHHLKSRRRARKRSREVTQADKVPCMGCVSRRSKTD